MTSLPAIRDLVVQFADDLAVSFLGCLLHYSCCAVKLHIRVQHLGRQTDLRLIFQSACERRRLLHQLGNTACLVRLICVVLHIDAFQLGLAEHPCFLRSEFVCDFKRVVDLDRGCVRRFNALQDLFFRLVISRFIGPTRAKSALCVLQVLVTPSLAIVLSVGSDVSILQVPMNRFQLVLVSRPRLRVAQDLIITYAVGRALSLLSALLAAATPALLLRLNGLLLHLLRAICVARLLQYDRILII